MGSGALRLGCNLHEGNPARQGGRGCRAGQPAFMRTCRIRGVRRLLWGVMRFVCAVTGMRGTPRRRRELHAGSACGAEEGAGSACRVQPAAEGILKEEGKNPLLAAKKVGGAAGGALYWILITR